MTLNDIPLASYSSPEGSPLPRTPLELHSSPVSPSAFAACSTSSLNSTFSDLELADLPSPWAVPFVYRHPGTNNYALADYPTYEHCYDAAISVLPSTPISRQNGNVFAAATTGSVTTPITPQPQGPSGDRVIGDNNLGEKGRRGVPDSGSQGDAKKTTTTTTSEPNYNIRKYAGKRKGKVDLHGAPLAATRKRSKKAYQCPTPGCTKSYLNPNGLKYHQEKGTCKIESPASSPSTTSSPLPPMQQTSPISSSANPYPPPRSPLSSQEVPTHEIASTVLPPPPSPSSLLLQHHLLATIHQPQPRHALMHWATASASASAASSLNSSTQIAGSASAGLGGGVKAM
ncbi:hypothetical protein H0H93_005953 [Arthromyces matolae]|nr:hypothetical protein H0H93_005953 [Arthromyces matolae]